MLGQIQAELVYFGLSVLLGVVAGVLGNGLDYCGRRGCRHRLRPGCQPRRRHRRGGIGVGLLDLGYWICLGVALFLLCYFQNSGTLRAYALLGTLVGLVGGQWCFARVGSKWSKKGVAHSKKTS